MREREPERGRERESERARDRERDGEEGGGGPAEMASEWQAARGRWGLISHNVSSKYLSKPSPSQNRQLFVHYYLVKQFCGRLVETI